MNEKIKQGLLKADQLRKEILLTLSGNEVQICIGTLMDTVGSIIANQSPSFSNEQRSMMISFLNKMHHNIIAELLNAGDDA